MNTEHRIAPAPLRPIVANGGLSRPAPALRRRCALLMAATALTLAACTDAQMTPKSAPGTPAAADATPATSLVPNAPAAPPPSAGATTVEQFDTTSAEERAAATDTSSAGGEKLLGNSIGSLGSPTDPGFWAVTPLVKSATQGRLVHAPSGASVKVELRPMDAEPGAGTQISLPAFRALGLPLTDLPELEVYSGGAA